MIEIRGLTHKQKALCDIMWTISSREGVQDFIRTLPRGDQRDCHSLIECMQLAFLDEITDTDQARAELDRIRNLR